MDTLAAKRGQGRKRASRITRSSSAILTIAVTFAAPDSHAATQHYAIDSAHTMVSFDVRRFGITTEHAHFNSSVGSVCIDSRAASGTVDIVIDARSIYASSAFMERLIRSSALLDAERYPQVTYRAMRMSFVGDEPSRIEGVLTLRGVSKAVALKVTGYDCPSSNGLVPQYCRVSAVGMFRRSDFGMTGYKAVAGDKVRLAIEVEAVPVSKE